MDVTSPSATITEIVRDLDVTAISGVVYSLTLREKDTIEISSVSIIIHFVPIGPGAVEEVITIDRPVFWFSLRTRTISRHVDLPTALQSAETATS